MSLLSRLSTMLRIRAHSTLDKLEDPGQVMDYSYSKQLKHLEQLRQAIVEVVTNEKRLEMQQQALAARVDKLSTQARAVLQANREDLARLALQKKETLLLQFSSYEQQIAQLQAQEERLIAMERNVSARIEAFRTEKEMVKAQYSAAQAQVKIHEALTGISEEMTEIDQAMQRTQDKVLNMQARANAMETLIEQGTLDEVRLPGATHDMLDRELQQVAAQQNVEAQLQALKQQLQLGGAHPQQKQIEGPAIE
ncbi:MAG TPA: PspA/IM30 family protein [Ktedonobacteraceae bacterium]|jgi:phage shock protein A|nr:PspA/IM30 family protein [Ktedonobacteraceae bacterium]